MRAGFVTACASGLKIILRKKGKVPIEIIEKTIDNSMNKKYNPIFALYDFR
ncbi:hypothetical protein GCM10027043_43730 [Ferruginibacter profundus]